MSPSIRQRHGCVLCTDGADAAMVAAAMSARVAAARSIVEGLSDEGFTVAHAADGDAAREALRAGNWDLVILDWWLPGPDGLAVLEGHRREGGTTPVLFLYVARRGQQPDAWARRRRQ